jgi:hypothetical protein
MAWSAGEGRGRSGSYTQQAGRQGAPGEAEAMVEGTCHSSSGEGEGVKPDGGGTACTVIKPSLGSIVGGKGDQQRIKGTTSNRARNDPSSSGEDAANI